MSQHTGRREGVRFALVSIAWALEPGSLYRDQPSELKITLLSIEMVRLCFELWEESAMNHNIALLFHP